MKHWKKKVGAFLLCIALTAAKQNLLFSFAAEVSTNVVTVVEPTVLTANPAEGVTVEAQMPDGTFDESAEPKLNVKIPDISSEDADRVMNAVREKLADTYGEESSVTIAGAYVADISFLGADDEKVEPAGAVQITVTTDPVDFSIPEEASVAADACAVYHVTEDGQAEKLESGKILLDENNQFIGMRFESDSFSPFAAVIVDKPAALDDTGGNECRIGGTEYATLAEAFQKAVDGDTIELLKDVNLAQQNIEGKEFTLDLGNNEIVLSGQLTISEGADITLKGEGVIKLDSGAKCSCAVK